MPRQKPHISTAAGRTSATAQALDSDEDLDSDEPSDSDQASQSDEGSESDAEGGEVPETDSDGVSDLMPVNKDDEDATAADSSLEARRAGMPAGPSGQPAVTPGKQVVTCLPVMLLYGAVSSMLCVLC